MNGDQLDGIVHAVGALVGLLAWALAERSQGRLRRVGFVVVLLAGLGSFPGHDRLRGEAFLHPPELFHYVFGAKYFPELGYGGLYDACAAASVDAGLPAPEIVRDLQNGRVEVSAPAIARGQALLARFSPARREAFLRDLVVFTEDFGDAPARSILDHGFNATPPWIAIARLVLGDRAITTPHLLAWASIDVGLLLLVLLVWLRVFGLERSALAALFVGTAFTFRFAWIGGSFLRFDWLAALGLGIAALRRDRFALAGGLLGFASASRLFPVLFALTAALPWLVSLRRPSSRLALLAFGNGFLIAALALGALGLESGRGARGYHEFAARIGAHHGVWASNHVGLDTLAVVDRVLDDPPARAGALDPFQDYADPIEAARAARRPFLRFAVLGVLLALGAVARRLEPFQALPLGAILAFSLSTISGYYWVMLAPAPLVAPGRSVALLVACTFVHCAVELIFGSLTLAHVAISACYLAIFVDWIVAWSRRSPAQEAGIDVGCPP